MLNRTKEIQGAYIRIGNDSFMQPGVEKHFFIPDILH
jgi:hypothetical protein